MSDPISDLITDYILSDYQFLEDYEVVDSSRANRYSFVAHIRDTQQMVRFIKRRFTQDQFPRFQALHKLYKSGIVLADNMFILEECDQLYFYIIEAQIQSDNPRFTTLQMYLYDQPIEEEGRKAILSKVKVLIDCLHQEGQAYAGLDPRKIIIDEEQHLYLAPFELELQLKTDHFSRAYYPPECLLKMQKGQSEFSEELMLKWDVWSFGCIALDALKYASPVFMATSLKKQLHAIDTMKLEELVHGFQDSLQNIVSNSLKKDPVSRNISIHKIQREETVPKQTYSRLLSLKTDPQQSKGSTSETGTMRELNLHLNDEQGDSQLIFNLFSLSNIQFERELHLTIHLSKQFHFYLDSHQDANRKYQLRRRITVRGNFDQLANILADPVVIELEEAGAGGKVQVNLQTLVLVHEGKRIWNQQLLGTYTVDEGSEFLGAKLKISSVLLTPEILINQPQPLQQQLISDQKLQTAAEPKKATKPEAKQKPAQKTLARKKKDKPQQQTIPSISQIAQNIVLFTNQFKRKMSLTQKGEDQLQQQLQTLLEIP